MKRITLLLLVACAATAVSAGEYTEKTIRYGIGETAFESTIVWKPGPAPSRPGILIVPNWMGPTPESLDKAKSVAGDGFVVMMVDMYGTRVRPENSEEAGKAAGVVRADRELMRARANRALDEFLAAEDVPLDKNRIAAIGFCFGGGTILELGRSGTEIDAVISFHGDLLSPTLGEDAGKTKASVLVLHGADDPFVPQDHVQTFVEAMRATDVDWQLVQFANTVHSFTDPNASWPGQAEYHPQSAERAFEYMDELLEEIWELDD